MSNNGKIIYGGEAFEQNTDPSPGLGMGEIRYFVNEPTDPRWLKCDGNIHKRSSYPAYAATRPLPAWRFKPVTVPFGQNDEYFYGTGRNMLEENYRVFLRYDSDTYTHSIIKYDLNTGDDTVVVEGINSSDGYFFKFKNRDFFLSRYDSSFYVSDDNWETAEVIEISFNNAFNPEHFVITENIMITLINDGLSVLYSEDGVTFNTIQPDNDFDGIIRQWKYSPHDDREIFVLNDSLSGYISLDIGYDLYDEEWYDTPMYDDIRDIWFEAPGMPLDTPMVTKYGILSLRDNNTAFIYPNDDSTKRVRIDREKYIRTLFTVNGEPLFDSTEDYNISTLGFIQPTLEFIEFFNFDQHRDIQDSNVLNVLTQDNIYRSFSQNNPNELAAIKVDGTICHVISIYYEGDFTDGQAGIYVSIYHDPDYFHAPGLRASKIDGSFPYVWTGE